MRISTNSMYQSNVNQLNDIQNQLNNQYTQISTGKRVNTPADDPVAAAQIMNLNVAKQQNTDYTNTSNTANTYLQTYESNLSSVSNTVLSIQSSLVSAGNGTLSNTDRANLATTLQGQMQTLLGFANATDSQGNYLYSGSKVGTAAFDSSGNYQGDTNNLNLQVSPSTKMAVTYNGQQVFSTNGTSIFTTIQNTINLLNTPVTDSTTQSNLTSGMSSAISQVQDYLNQVQTTSADVGGKINQLSALNTTATNVNLQYTNSISNLQDLNYTQAISDLTKNQTILQAAQKSFVSTSQLSLFQYIS